VYQDGTMWCGILDLKIENRKTHVCGLKEAMYVLKQAPRAWYSRIDSFLTSLGFTKSKVDSNLYFKVMNDEPMMFLLYVDLLTASSTRGSTPCIMKICINRCKHVEDFLVLQGIFCSSTQFCKRDYRTPARVYNVIGLHGSC
jgi:hypothetical protein